MAYGHGCIALKKACIAASLFVLIQFVMASLSQGLAYQVLWPMASLYEM
jgi:hypothetical protein